MSGPVTMDGVGALADRFDVFLVDQFGVLHDGERPYPGAVEALERLTTAGKRCLLLSNSGKRAAPNEARLERLGFRKGSWTAFLSSGDVAWKYLQAEYRDGLSRKCLLISRDDDRSAVEGLPLALTASGEDADVILLSASEGDRYGLDHYRQLLAPAAERAVPCLCTNPDKIMLTASGPRFGAGRIAELYEEMGGPVTWIGKPFPQIYAAALELLRHPDPTRVICIGDSVEHDIAGGQAAGLKTALVATGIIGTATQEDRRQLFREHGATPDYLLPGFRW
ncbi:TIGR01459 family HAD-type hydrolase [Labrenzia sp. 011]|uniref:TIGR01459 family HAD-type hydrolase n=1 Tax=Labrenzia sp. 011 TaxID=2171494 RepID=UPI000D50A193|nr:TIGR01459 family HAD-type hydrolase [Labrenzia sp. 011]PVB62852.1 TIGR01459 family HAD-type hydrolase [Labrenzia sp. 011]